MIASSYLLAVLFLALNYFEDMAANSNHRQILAGPDGGLKSQNSTRNPTAYITSRQLQGQTIHVELEEPQR